MKYNYLTISVGVIFACVVIYIYMMKLPEDKFEKFSLFYSPLYANDACYIDEFGNTVCDDLYPDSWFDWSYFYPNRWGYSSGYWNPWFHRFSNPNKRFNNYRGAGHHRGNFGGGMRGNIGGRGGNSPRMSGGGMRSGNGGRSGGGSRGGKR